MATFSKKIISYILTQTGVVSVSIHTAGGGSGSGYVTGDTVRVVTGNSDCILTLTALAGAVTALSITVAGTGYTNSSNTSTSNVSSSGSGLKVDVNIATTLSSVVLDANFRGTYLDKSRSGAYVFSKVIVQALFSNTGFIALGSAPIPYNGTSYVGTENGIQLAAGQIVEFDDFDLSLLKMCPYVTAEGIIVNVVIDKTT